MNVAMKLFVHDALKHVNSKNSRDYIPWIGQGTIHQHRNLLFAYPTYVF